jgi:2-succinyl-5-enolpyruvyl-6-hydroxy-3-cyclohexene-1-carboxylate synthase
VKPENVNYLYVGAFVDELVRAGVRHICICPGSRSTPLAMMFVQHPDLNVWMHLDERSAAFFALGLAKARRESVALLCTSGTAAANFMPAVVEAHYGRVPLLVLTADRPPELRDIGAPQTVDQLRLYGNHAKWFVEMALPESTPDALRYVRTVAARATAESIRVPAGPVHLNFPLREPLIPLVPDTIPDSRIGHYTAVSSGLRSPEPSLIRQLAADLTGIERGLLICGPQDDPELAAAVSQLAARLNYPVLADPLSQVRCGPHDRANMIDSYDAFLRDAVVVGQIEPEVVLRFGAMPTSKPILLYLQRYPNARQIIIDGGAGWNDPTLLAADMIHVDAQLFCAALTAEISPSAGDSEWLIRWRELNHQTQLTVAAQIESFADPFEGRVFSELSALLPDGATLYASSSMPVRDMDTFFRGSQRAIRFFANRGANGIDGDAPLVLVLGDLAFYHDMNGLMAAKLHKLKATIILINNDGGGIFSFLPQAAYPEHFEQLFGTPHGLDFRPAAEMYGALFTRATDWPTFRSALAAGIQADGLNIIEVPTNREQNVKLHRSIWAAVSAQIAQKPEQIG